MVAIQQISARIGRITGKGIAGALSNKQGLNCQPASHSAASWRGRS